MISSAVSRDVNGRCGHSTRSEGFRTSILNAASYVIMERTDAASDRNPSDPVPGVWHQCFFFFFFLVRASSSSSHLDFFDLGAGASGVDVCVVGGISDADAGGGETETDFLEAPKVG